MNIFEVFFHIYFKLHNLCKHMIFLISNHHFIAHMASDCRVGINSFDFSVIKYSTRIDISLYCTLVINPSFSKSFKEDANIVLVIPSIFFIMWLYLVPWFPESTQRIGIFHLPPIRLSANCKGHSSLHGQWIPKIKTEISW